MDAGVEAWIRARVGDVLGVDVVHQRPWATVTRVDTSDGPTWFKACAPIQAFEPRLTAELFARWPDRVPEVLGFDERRSWLLLADAGTPIGVLGNPPETWLEALPRYAELQRRESAHAQDHLAHGVPDLRIAMLPARYEDLLADPLPLGTPEVARLRAFAPRFARLCDALAAHDVPETIQHDDLHMSNVYLRGGDLRVLDWGDSSISHPFVSLVETFRFLEERNGLPPSSPWFARLRDAYLEPWAGNRVEAFELAMRVGAFAHALAWKRQRDHLPDDVRPTFDGWFAIILRRALGQGIV